MTLDELTPWLFSRVTGGIRWGLERTEELLAGVDDPHRRFHSIHIAGTNGKGSVAALCDAALRAEGRLRVGLYTSPHLVSFNERIRVGGVPVPDDVIVEAAEELRPAIERTGASFFEATTAIAFHIFAKQQVDIAVVEVGLGGRLDATNVITPLVCAITNVAVDHEEYLGSSLARIAEEKAGIFKAGVPAISGVRDPEVQEVLQAVAAREGAPFRPLDGISRTSAFRNGIQGVEMDVMSERWGRVHLRTPLSGEHQGRNAALALEVLGALPDGIGPSLDAVCRGFENARWPGRLQVVDIRGTTYLLDVAHNPAGAETLAGTLDDLELPRPVVGVVGILNDKDWRSMLVALSGSVDVLVLTTPPSAPPARRWEPARVREWMMDQKLPAVRLIPDFQGALERATTMAPHGTVLVTGSVHTVGDAMLHLGISVE